MGRVKGHHCKEFSNKEKQGMVGLQYEKEGDKHCSPTPLNGNPPTLKMPVRKISRSHLHHQLSSSAFTPLASNGILGDLGHG